MLTIDQLLQQAEGAKLRPAEQRRLTDALEQRLFALLSDDPADEALIAVHDRWAHRPWAEERRLEALHDLAHLEVVFGVQVNPHEHDSPEEALAATMATLRGQAQAQFAEEEARWAAREAKRQAKRQARQQAGQQNKGQGGASAAPEAAQAVSQSLREIYRKLASALHPDRASDDADRARRHALMQKVNQANDAKDLLTLLQLQLEWATTEGGVGALADESSWLPYQRCVDRNKVTSLRCRAAPS
ncbi:MAG: J domain-containing protein [Ideonella sp.]|nr:J domain-containing protein [Ideonella sp.]